ncbi:MAG: Do family serine endopeptidase [Limisphaerales bacterium]
MRFFPVEELSKAKSIGLALGVAIFIALGLLVFVAAEFTPARYDLKPGPIVPSVATPAEQLGDALAMVANHVEPSVVTVYSEKTVSFPFDHKFFRKFLGAQPHGFQGEQEAMGSGMIVDKKGYILTNCHVVRGADDIQVRLDDGRIFDAQIVGLDQKTDVAVIRIKGRVPSGLPTVTLGDSDTLHTGDLVMAIGAPFGLLHTVTQGIISATGRADVGLADYDDFLQTDAPINPGNSGGPLVDMLGKVIGMNTAISTSVGQFAGVGFSIPSDMIKEMLPRLMKGETIIRGHLGVITQRIDPDFAQKLGLPKPEGVLINQVNPDSPAKDGGIENGDVIVQYNGTGITSQRQFRDLVANTPPGTAAKIGIVRGGKTKMLVATIGSRTDQAAATSRRPGAGLLSELGLTLQNLTPSLAQKMKASHGVKITGVDPGSPAALAGLQKGDVIAGADNQPVASADGLENLLAADPGDNQALLLIIRSGTSMIVLLQM